MYELLGLPKAEILSVGPQTAASASPRKLLKMQILGPHFRSTEAIYALASPPGDSDWILPMHCRTFTISGPHSITVDSQNAPNLHLRILLMEKKIVGLTADL